ncbi:hypothetical protein K457DRAFT_33482, partial [Linnemannia elongata AG-77]
LHLCRLSLPHLLLSFANANNLSFTLTPSTTPASQFLDPLQPLLFHNHTHTHTFSLRPIPFSSSSSSSHPPPSTNTNTPSNNDSLVVNHLVRSSGSSGLVSLSNSRRPGEQAPVCTHPHALQNLHQPLYPERQHYPQLRCRSALAPLCLQVRILPSGAGSRKVCLDRRCSITLDHLRRIGQPLQKLPRLHLRREADRSRRVGPRRRLGLFPGCCHAHSHC